MWPFRRQKPWHQLGASLPAIVYELRSRKHWERFPEPLVTQISTNAAYVFDDTAEAQEALKHFVFLLESPYFPGRLQQIARAKEWRPEVSLLANHLIGLAGNLCETTIIRGPMDGIVIYAAATSSLLCQRYALSSYTFLARFGLTIGRNLDEGARWCDRYRRAERDLLAEEVSNLDSYSRAVRELLDPQRAREMHEEMRTVLPKDLLDKYVPDFDSADPAATPRDVAEALETVMLEATCHGPV
jgi:hypothetical protein